MVLLNRIKEKKVKFLTTMVIIIISATMINYGLSSLFSAYFNTIDNIYMGVQLNLWITILVIAIITVLMLLLLPKQTVDELFKDINGNGNGGSNGILTMNGNNSRTPDQQLQDMIDYNDEELDNKK